MAGKQSSKKEGENRERTRRGPGGDQGGPGEDEERTRRGPGEDQERTRREPGGDQERARVSRRESG